MLYNNNHKIQKSPERYISSRVIIDKVYRDLNLEEDNDRWQDIIEWIGEAIEAIHISYTLQSKTVQLEVSNFRALLPCDFYSLIMAKVNGVASKESANPFDFNSNQPRSIRSHFIEYPYIKLNCDNGFVDLAYYAFPLDNENFPLVPDNYQVKEALMWYILKKMIMGGWKHSDPTFSYVYCNDKWNEYCRKSKAYYKMPDLAEMESLKTYWVRLVPQIHAHNNGFANYNSGEQWRV